MKKFNSLRLDLAEKTLTPAEKKKREEIAMAMERENPGMPMGKKMAIATATAKRVAEENLDELKSSTLTSYIDKVATGPSRGNKNIKAIGGVTTAIRKRAENENPPFEPNVPTGERKDQFGNPIKNVAKHLAKQGMKSVTEEIKTTHEDPLVVVKDAEGNILTHANRSVAGDIHGINVSHHAIHTGMPVEVVDRDGKKLTVHKSMHHDSEVAKYSASAVKEAKEKTEYDYEGDMARSQLQSIVMNAQKVHDMLKDNDNLPEWVQSKITLAEDYILTVSNYMATEIDEETNKEYTHKVVHNKTGNIVGKYTSLKAATRAADKKDNAYGGYAHQVRRIDEDKDPCWDNYKQFGMKKGKNGKPVPDCRGPVKEDSIDELTLSFGKKAKPTVSARISDMKKYFDTADKDQVKQKITGKKFHDMSEYETWMKSNKSKGSMQVASFEQGDENKLDEISSNTLHSYMKAAHTKYSNIDHKNDPASVAKKNKLEKGIKTAYNKKYPSKTSKPEDKVDMSSASSYYASKKPGQYTGD